MRPEARGRGNPDLGSVKTQRAERKRITRRPGERREELLDAAARVFAEKSVARSTVSDITRSAGVAKGTLYLYFDSKGRLLGSLKGRFVDQMLQEAGSLYEHVGGEDWRALVDETVNSFVDFMVANCDMCHVMIQEGVTPETSPKSNEMFGDQGGRTPACSRSRTPSLPAGFCTPPSTGPWSTPSFTRRGSTGAGSSPRELVHKALAP
jgi:AcrR family transcriptional regulator